MPERVRVVMMGTGTFARPTSEMLLDDPAVNVVGLVTQPDRDAGQQRGSTRQTGLRLKEIAEARGVPVFQPESVNTAEGSAQIRAWQPDILVVAAYGQILNADVLGSARWGGINVHGSLLPKYRGAAPVAHAILNGETRTGVTIIRMTTGLDAGDMLAQEALDIGPDETAGELEARLAPLGARLALRVVADLQRAGEAGLPRNPQDAAGITKAPKLKKEHGRIDWRQPAERIARKVRAMQPWPTAYTFLHANQKPALRVIINRAAVVLSEAAEPGTVLITDGRLIVGCGEAAVEIVELQPAGKKRMTAQEFQRGHGQLAGARFGDESG